MRVLIVDDDPVFASTVQVALRAEAGIQVDAATSVAAATALLDAIDYGLIVLDLDLGGGASGITVLETVRRSGSVASIPVIVVSQHLPRYMTDLIEFYSDVSATVAKPVDPLTIRTLVQRLGGGRSTSDARDQV